VTPIDTAKALVAADAHHALAEVIPLVHPLAADQFRKRQLSAIEAVPWAILKDRAGPRAKRLQSAVEHNQTYVLNSVYYVVLERRPDFDHATNMPPSRVEVMTMKNAHGLWQSMFDGGLQSGELFVLGAESFERGDR
jgi:hypothetical protein